MAEVALRPIDDSDLDALFAQMRDPESVWMSAFTAKDPNDREAFDAHMSKVRASPDGTMRAVVRGGRLVGSIASFVREGDTEVTYWVDRSVWGQGVASQALALFLDTVSDRPVYARAASDNVGSLRVLQRAGFAIIGTEISYQTRGAPKSRKPFCVSVSRRAGTCVRPRLGWCRSRRTATMGLPIRCAGQRSGHFRGGWRLRRSRVRWWNQRARAWWRRRHHDHRRWWASARPVRVTRLARRLISATVSGMSPGSAGGLSSGVAYTTLTALDTRPAQPTYWRLTPAVCSPLFLLTGLVQHHHRVRIVVHAQVRSDECGHDAHRRVLVPHRMVQQPLRLVWGGITAHSAICQPFFRGTSTLSA